MLETQFFAQKIFQAKQIVKHFNFVYLNINNTYKLCGKVKVYRYRALQIELKIKSLNSHTINLKNNMYIYINIRLISLNSFDCLLKQIYEYVQFHIVT